MNVIRVAEIEFIMRAAMFCPACKMLLTLPIHKTENAQQDGPGWAWNGSLESPTLTPSILTVGGPVDKRTRCHAYITDGNWVFLDDCTHEYAGKTVPMVQLIADTTTE